MSISVETQSPYLQSGNIGKPRGLTRNVTEGGMTMEPEKTEEEKQLQGSSIFFQRELTPEEEKRVLFLQNMLSQLLTMADGKPTEEQKARIKEVEAELEKITGVKMRSSLSNTVDKMIGAEDEDEEARRERQMKGIDPKEAKHSRKPDTSNKSENPGMQMLQRNAMFANLKSVFDSSGSLTIKS